jgi:enediyne biosynthesis protein E4
VRRISAALAMALGLWACGKGGDSASPRSRGSASKQVPALQSPIRFKEVTARAGIAFVHQRGTSSEKYVPETLGSGVCLFDYDGDGWQDIYFVQSGPLPVDPHGKDRPTNVLYRGRGGGAFEDVTRTAGVGGNGFVMGCTVADIDNDGDADLYVTNYGPDVLYRNNGDGTFSDVTRAAGVEAGPWNSSAAFGDYDGDGLVDLFVVDYIDFQLDNGIYCGDSKPGYRQYCHPENFSGLPDFLFKNLGSGRFRDVTREAGLYDPSGKGLGVVWGDFDGDGREDLYVANDSTPNFLYHNRGDGTFAEIGQKAGVAVGEEGIPRAGMGIAVADCDGNGKEDLFITNLAEEPNSLFRNDGNLLFADATFPSGLGSPSLLFLGFGSNFFDADADGDPDLFVANGHILDNVGLYSDTITYEQTPFLFENLGGCRFRDVSTGAGEYFRLRNVARGSAVGDLDNDGDPDLVVSCNNRPAHVLLNETAVSSGGWLALQLQGKKGRDALGAWVEVDSGGRRQWAEVRSASSYLSQGEMTLYFGLGGSSRAERVHVRWPGGFEQDYGPLAAGLFYFLEEGKAAGAGIPPGRPRKR